VSQYRVCTPQIPHDLLRTRTWADNS
jgi:hypothetical protein